jgi:hypothetical protein
LRRRSCSGTILIGLRAVLAAPVCLVAVKLILLNFYVGSNLHFCRAGYT